MEFGMAIQVKDNFLPQQEFNKIKEIVMGDNFPWYYNDFISNPKDPSSYLYFTHTFYRHPGETSDWFYLFNNFLKLVGCNSIIRIKANLHLSQKRKRTNEHHVDYEFKHKGCLLYLNDNDGATYFEKKAIIPKENRVVFFDPSKKHASSVCTNENRRVNINFNYF